MEGKGAERDATCQIHLEAINPKTGNWTMESVPYAVW